MKPNISKIIPPNPTQAGNETNIYLKRMQRILEEEFGQSPEELNTLFWDIEKLFAGQWPTHEACQIQYHTLGHTLEVALACCRMLSGWNRAHPETDHLSEECFMTCLASALFHDTGYHKDKGDHIGRGGKLTYVHVRRSCDMATTYLQKRHWTPARLAIIEASIQLTDVAKPVQFKDPIATFPGRQIAAILSTADLLAQMADVDYMERLHDLFAEFKEAYDFEGADNLTTRGVYVFHSAQEMISGTVRFFENFVVPRFETLGRMDRYLNVFFASSRNPYTECLTTNLYRTNTGEGMQPHRRLGEMLTEFGLVSTETLEKTLAEQRQIINQHSHTSERANPKLRLDRLIDWLAHTPRKTLGELLVDKGELSSSDLHWVVQERLLPSKMLEALSFKDLVFLLRLGIMISHVRHSPRILSEGLEALNDELASQASSILLAEEETQSLVIVSAAGRNTTDIERVSIPWDKGVAGWVYCQGRSAIVDNVNYDRRFFKEVDVKTGFSTRSILAVPLILNGQVIGVVEAINKQKGAGIFDERDLYIITIFAQQVSGALDAYFSHHDKS